MSPSSEQQLQQQQAAAAMMGTSPDGDSGDINREETRRWMENLLHEARIEEEVEAKAKQEKGQNDTAKSVQQNQCETKPPVLIETVVCAQGTGDEENQNVVHINEPNINEVLKENESIDEESARSIRDKINDGKHESTLASQQVCSLFSAAVAIFVAAPGENNPNRSVSPKIMPKEKHRKLMLDETYDISDGDSDISPDALSAAADARHPSRKSVTATIFDRRNSIFARVIFALILALFIGVGLMLTSGKGNRGVDESAFGSTGSRSTDIALFPSTEPSIVPSSEPSMPPSLSPSIEPSIEPSNGPSNEPSNEPSYVPSYVPSTKPSIPPSLSPSSSPSSNPVTSSPTGHPSDPPTVFLTSTPTSSPTDAPTSIPPTSPAPTESSFIPGDLAIVNTDLDIRISSGLSVKVIARTGEFTEYGDGSSSNQRLHGMMDGAGIVPLPDGGYVYLSNSEEER
jgi:hypothetical protein